ncbi:PPA1309 family protein [Nocardioides ochotonae]|uniref:PPA1309 family protein n=1 Tax=Nocardioides ochotonae TaxID=2685869 RepID=UPI001CD762AD|nr:PPA1309 family protein [Nocardioides ochotonae]
MSEPHDHEQDPGTADGPETTGPEAPDLTGLDDLDVDPALASAVLEIEHHVAEAGWDQPARLYALVDTAELVRREPALASMMGLDAASAEGSFTPVEQDQLRPDQLLEQVLEAITWPPEVAGCAAVVERLVLPPDADGEVPEDAAAAEQYAREHPDRQEVRMVAGVTRAGATYCALRLRAHDEDTSVVGGTDLVPALVAMLAATLTDDPDETDEARA